MMSFDNDCTEPRRWWCSTSSNRFPSIKNGNEGRRGVSIAFFANVALDVIGRA